MDAAQWPQVGLARSTEDVVVMAPQNNTNSSTRPLLQPWPQLQQPQQQQRQGSLDLQRRATARLHKDENLNCPRCNSANTKFCYYNNYSLSQPRYFCKTCRRYWTKGGSLRNVPAGGGSRKNRRSSSKPSSYLPSPSPSLTSTSSSITRLSDLDPSLSTSLSHFINTGTPHHRQHLHGQDLNLSFSTTPTPQDYILFQHLELSKNIENLNSSKSKVELGNSTSADSRASKCSPNSISNPSAPLSALELLRTGMASSGLSSYAPIKMSFDSNSALYPPGFSSLLEFKPNLMGLHPATRAEIGANKTLQSVDETKDGDANARLLFPFGNVNKTSDSGSSNTTTHAVDQRGNIGNHHQGSSGYWNGVLGGTW